MSRKGNCLDNAATEQIFGHLKDEFFKNQSWTDFQSFKADFYHWNHKRHQERLLRMTPVEYRNFVLSRENLSVMKKP